MDTMLLRRSHKTSANAYHNASRLKFKIFILYRLQSTFIVPTIQQQEQQQHNNNRNNSFFQKFSKAAAYLQANESKPNIRCKFCLTCTVQCTYNTSLSVGWVVNRCIVSSVVSQVCYSRIFFIIKYIRQLQLLLYHRALLFILLFTFLCDTREGGGHQGMEITSLYTSRHYVQIVAWIC